VPKNEDTNTKFELVIQSVSKTRPCSLHGGYFSYSYKYIQWTWL